MVQCTVGHEISRIITNITQQRAQKLRTIGAPEIVIQSCDNLIAQAKSNVSKLVSGMSRKFKGLADEEIIEPIHYIDTVGEYYKEGKKNTRVFRFVTDTGIYYYDCFERKIDKVNSDGYCYGIVAKVNEKDFR